MRSLRSIPLLKRVRFAIQDRGRSAKSDPFFGIGFPARAIAPALSRKGVVI
jgi:hypothetical protein